MSARFLLNKSIALEQYKKLRQLGVSIAYSVKTNPLIAPILEKETKSEFTMHAMEPLDTIKNKSRIWYYALAWDEREIGRLLAKGIKKFVVDNEADLALLESALEKNKEKISLLLRQKLQENTVFTGRHYVFGMDAKVVNRRIAELKKNPGIDRLGVHVHRKSQNVSEWSLAREVGETLTEDTLNSIDIINIGGGMPAKYSNSSDTMLKVIFDKIREFVKFVKPYGITVIAEPGRYIAAPAVVLETTIKRITGNTIIVDASVYNTAMDTLIVPLKLLVEGELEDDKGNGGNGKEGKSYIIKGCTPCSLDIFRYRVWLKEPRVGDLIRFLNAGAYNFTTEFCELPKVETVEN